jgi:hypothetical protein
MTVGHTGLSVLPGISCIEYGMVALKSSRVLHSPLYDDFPRRDGFCDREQLLYILRDQLPAVWNENLPAEVPCRA